MCAVELYNVIIFKDERMSPNPCRIAPATVLAGHGDLVFFKNMADVAVLVKFLGHSPFSEDEFVLQPSDLGNQNNIKTIVNEGPGVFKFDAHLDNKIAQGSRPIIVVYDK